MTSNANILIITTYTWNLQINSTYPTYEMVSPLVLSSFSSLSWGWTSRAIHLQNTELTLETCAPELINRITFCPSTMIGASYDHPTRQAVMSGFRKRMAGVTSHLSLCLAAFIFAGLSLGLGGNARCLLFPWAAVTGQGGWLHSLSSSRLV